MKKTLLSFTLACLCISSYAQSGYVQDAMERKYGEPGEKQLDSWLNGKVLNAKVQNEYAFSLYVNMHTTSYKNGDKKDENDIKYYINPTTGIFASQPTEQKKGRDQMFMIYDYKSNTMLMLNDKDMTGMAININAFMSKEAIDRRESGKAPEGKPASTTDCNKTGKTKTILGYKCDEYVCTDADRNTRSEMWVTTKIPVNITQSNMRGPMATYFKGAQNMSGMLMEGNFYKNETLQMTMLVTELDPKTNKVVKSADYKINQH